MPSGRTVIRIIPVFAVLLLNWSTAGAQFFQNVDEWLKQRQAMNFTAKAPVLATNGNMAVYYYYNNFYVGVLARYTNRIHLAIGDAGFFNGSTTSVAHLSAGIRF